MYLLASILDDLKLIKMNTTQIAEIVNAVKEGVKTFLEGSLELINLGLNGDEVRTLLT